MKIQFSLFLLCLFLASTAFAQTTVTGKITDEETSEDLIGANVTLSQNGVFKAGCSTDFDGNYSMKVDPGVYDLEVSYIGYPNKLIKDIEVVANKSTTLNVALSGGPMLIGCEFGMYSICYKIPLLERDNPNTMNTISDEAIRNLPTKNIKEIIRMTPGISTGF